MAISNVSGRRAGLSLGAALLGGGMLAGLVLTGTSSASAADSTTSPTANQSGAAAACTPGQRPEHQPLSDADAAKVKAAALEAVPGGTVTRTQAGHGDAAYHAHVTKADGSKVRANLDKDFAVIGTEADSGRAGGYRGGPGDDHVGGTTSGSTVKPAPAPSGDEATTAARRSGPGGGPDGHGRRGPGGGGCGHGHHGGMKDGDTAKALGGPHGRGPGERGAKPATTAPAITAPTPATSAG